MAYVNVGVNAPKKKEVLPKKDSVLKQAVDLTQTGIKASGWLNKRNEKLLSESGYLDLKTPARDLVKPGADGADSFTTEPGLNIFSRKPGKGPLRKAEDRIRLNDEGKKHFEKLARENNTFAREEYLKYAESQEGNLLDVNLGGWGLKDKKMEKLVGKRDKQFYPTQDLDDVISTKPESKEGMKSVLGGDVPLYNESQALQEAAQGAASQAQSIIGPFAPEISGGFNKGPSAMGDLNSLITPMTGVQEPASTLGMVTSGIQNDAKRWMNKGQDFLGAPQLKGTTLNSLGGNIGTPFKPSVKNKIFPGVLDAVQDPKKALMDKAMSSLGIKPGLLAGMGPMGMFAQMALGKLLKPHTVAGKLFKLFG